MKRKRQKRVRSKLRARSSRPSRKNTLMPPKTALEYFSMPEQSRETYDKTVHVISEMRAHGVSLRRASREFGVDPKIVASLGRSALRKRSNGRYVAQKRDQLLRVLTILTSEGNQEIAIRDSRQASTLGRYWASVQKYLQTGDSSALEPFQGKVLSDLNGRKFELITDPNELNRLGFAGAFSFESIYARSA